MKCQHCKSEKGKWNGYSRYKSGITGRKTVYHIWYCYKCGRLTAFKDK